MKKIILMLAAIVLGAIGLAADSDNLVDQRLAKEAVAVLRVQVVFSTPLPKYPLTRYHVRPSKVFKNESTERLNGDFQVHAFKDREGIPPGECTIYIARYDVANKQFDRTNGTIWMLVGGDATNGVSHVTR